MKNNYSTFNTLSVIDCGKVTPIPKGNIQYLNGTTYLNSVIQISCSENYKLVGDSTRICQKNRQWSGVLPKCEGKSNDI